MHDYCDARMQRSILFTAVVVLSNAAVSAQVEPSRVTFRLHAPTLAEDASVYIAGSSAGLGNWQPDAKRMDYAGDFVWTFTTSFPEGKTIEYKYTLGSWSREGADDAGNPLQNFMHTVDGPTSIYNRIDGWADRRMEKFEGQITGTVKYHRELSAEGIRPRDVVVWLPPNYEASTRRYPVLYMHDGQNLFDPKTSAFGIDWQIDETCTQLIAEDVIEPLIVVGIYNTPDRTKEYLPGELGDQYRDFVVARLKPLIDKQYRTRPLREDTLVGGSLAGGLCAFMLAWEYSKIFSKAICMSPAFQIENQEKGFKLDYVQTVESSLPPARLPTLYIDNGGQGVDARLQPGVDAMLVALKNKGLQRDQELFVVFDPDAPHSEPAWASRFPKAITTLLPRH